MIEIAAWIPSLLVHSDPIANPQRLPSGDWRQDTAHEMPSPLWATTAAELAGRVSIENNRGLYALQLLGVHSGEEAANLLALGGWANMRSYCLGAEESARPVEDGFIRRLRFWRSEATEQPTLASAVVHAFFAAEQRRIPDMESWLRTNIGAATPVGRVYQWIDYPVFDNGTMCLGFAILVHGPELHVWSRVVHAHK